VEFQAQRRRASIGEDYTLAYGETLPDALEEQFTVEMRCSSCDSVLLTAQEEHIPEPKAGHDAANVVAAFQLVIDLVCRYRRTRDKMDPEAALTELLEFAEDEEGPHGPGEIQRIKELLVGLDGWLSQGGFLPAKWQQGR